MEDVLRQMDVVLPGHGTVQLHVSSSSAAEAAVSSFTVARMTSFTHCGKGASTTCSVSRSRKLVYVGSNCWLGDGLVTCGAGAMHYMTGDCVT